MLDKHFRLLSEAARRRVLLELLDQSSGGVPVDVVGDSHLGQPIAGPDHTSMIHTHLPKLERAGLIRWDRTSGTIYRGERFEEIEPLLVVLRDNEDALEHDLR